jgi:SWI/SNF-related matrix-associated actin-dependent regulator 1 of chromatin subfamily A
LEDGERRLVVFGNHRELLAQVHAMAMGAGAASALLVGGVPQAQRDAAVAAFQDPTQEGPRVLCCNFTAAGTGLTLTASAHVIILETPWTPGDLDQAEDRCHRIGQVQSLLIDLLAVEGTLDEWCADHMATKRERVAQLTLPEPAP